MNKTIDLIFPNQKVVNVKPDTENYLSYKKISSLINGDFLMTKLPDIGCNILYNKEAETLSLSINKLANKIANNGANYRGNVLIVPDNIFVEQINE